MLLIFFQTAMLMYGFSSANNDQQITKKIKDRNALLKCCMTGFLEMQYGYLKKKALLLIEYHQAFSNDKR